MPPVNFVALSILEGGHARTFRQRIVRAEDIAAVKEIDPTSDEARAGAKSAAISSFLPTWGPAGTWFLRESVEEMALKLTGYPAGSASVFDPLGVSEGAAHEIGNAVAILRAGLIRLHRLTLSPEDTLLLQEVEAKMSAQLTRLEALKVLAR